MILDEPARLEAADRDALIALWVAAWTAAMPDIDFAARRPWIAERLGPRPGVILIVARPEPGARPEGFAQVDVAQGYLDQLAVHPDQQGAGFGRRLLDSVKALCPSGMALHVNTDNGRAVRFYERQGFAVTGEGRNPQSGLPILAMRWQASAT